MPSIALGNFRSSLAFAEELMALESAYADPPPPIDEAKVAGLRGGAAVLMVAAFEAYLKSGVAELVGPLLGPPHKQLNTLPEQLQVASVYESLELAMRGPRYGQPSKKIDRLPDILSAAIRIAAGQIDANAMSQTKSNPGPETVIRLLKCLGISDPLSHIRPTFDARWGQPEAATFLRDKLKEIIDRRNRVAHSADALSIGRNDLSTARRFLSVLAETIDEDLQAHIATL